MNNSKEKSAVGDSTPATEKTNNISSVIDYSIPDEREKIKCVIQRPGVISEIVEINNTIEAMHDIVGGATTVVTIPENRLKLTMNIHSKRKGKPNLKTLWGRIYGTVLITTINKDQYVGLTPQQIQSARAWLLKHTYEEEEK